VIVGVADPVTVPVEKYPTRLEMKPNGTNPVSPEGTRIVLELPIPRIVSPADRSSMTIIGLPVVPI
jgi:hypothetical protein